MTAWFGRRRAEGVVEVAHDLGALTSGFWGVVVTFEGQVTAIRYEQVAWTDGRRSFADRKGDRGAWPGVAGEWSSSLDQAAYRAAVEDVRSRIGAGTTYQVNVCRVLSAPVTAQARIGDLGCLLAQGNPAPYACTIDEPDIGIEVACASPELFLGRDGSRLLSRPIKGTAAHVDGLLAKDYAENVMIADLVRNDLAQVCRPGTISVDHLCRPETHPGVVHLVTDVSGHLNSHDAWPQIFAATFPPGSVSGAPKSTALQAIRELEPVARGPYCGAIGWVDADAQRASLAVGIRTFWISRRHAEASLSFGTGAGITWASDPVAEWEETELKARLLVSLASRPGVALGESGDE